MKTIVFQFQHQDKGFPKEVEKLFDKENKFLELRSENDIKLHVKEIEKKGTRIAKKNSGYNLAGFDHFESEFLAELERVKYRDLEDMVCRTELTYDEIGEILDICSIGASSIGHTSPARVYEISDVNLMLKFFFQRLSELKIQLMILDKDQVSH